MEARREVVCPLKHGLHARPASALAEQAASFQATIRLTNLRTREVADARSVLELVAAGVMAGDNCVIECQGDDAEVACAVLASFMEAAILVHDTPLPAKAAATAGRVPRALRECDTALVTGIPASPGLGRGKLLQLGGLQLPRAPKPAIAPDPATEEPLATTAFNRTLKQLGQPSRGETRTARDIRRAMLAMASDPALCTSVVRRIRVGKLTAAAAVVAAIEKFAARLRASDSEYLRARVADLADIGQLLLANLPGGEAVSTEIRLDGPTILVAQSLATSTFMNLDRKDLAGLALGDAGTTAHVVILARSFGVPCLCGIDAGTLAGPDGEAVIDGTQGFVASPITAEVERYLERERGIIARIDARQAEAREAKAVTRDGRRVELAANIATVEEATAARDRGAEGVGLFRTEMLFAATAAEPTEDEQFEVYAAAARAMDGRTVIIRTLDIGGDKPLSYLDLPAEANPFLGYRGIRIYADHGELLTRHLRGIIRSSAHGKVWVMAPMVSGPAQARWFLDRVREQQRALAGEGVEFDPAMPVGVMIEIPSAAIQIDALCEVVDFFSVGTNDLTQYLLAMERGNPAIADIYEELHPALIRMLHSVVETAHSKGKWVGLCGELARNPRYTPLLVGLGFDELSMSAPAIPAVKSAIAGCSHQQAAELAARAFACSTAADIRSVLDEHAASGRPLTGPGLILVGADCRNKAEAIRELCALIQLDGRCADMNELEDAVWAREETYSTGLGHGIAIPHCKSDLVAAGSLALLKLDQAIEWGAVDDQPVDLVLMLVMPEGDEGNRHLKIFAALARRLMHEEFRAGLRAAEDADGIIAFLDQEIGIDDPKGQINE